MNTFLPLSSYLESAMVLDDKTLNKQGFEALEILSILLFGSIGNRETHPAVRMWRGNEWELALYAYHMRGEWIRRGNSDTLMIRCRMLLEALRPPANDKGPIWLGDEKLHSRHRANLLYRRPKFYARYNWEEKASKKHYWPVRKQDATHSAAAFTFEVSHEFSSDV